MSDSKFATFVASKKLNLKRLLVVSHSLETLQHADRVAKRARVLAKGPEGKAVEGAEKPAKPRSGRPVTPRALDAAMKGGVVSGPTKQRILRAVNYLLEQKKGEKVELKTLFGK